jgi:hypothetical protein
MNDMTISVFTANDIRVLEALVARERLSYSILFEWAEEPEPLYSIIVHGQTGHIQRVLDALDAIGIFYQIPV